MSENVYRTVYAWLFAANIPTIIATALVGLVLLTPSSQYINPKLWVYDSETGTVSFTREVTEAVRARWVHEIVTVDGLECSASGETFYDPVDNNLVQFLAPEKLKPCLEAASYRQVMLWQVLLFDLIPLPPVTLEQTKP